MLNRKFIGFPSLPALVPWRTPAKSPQRYLFLLSHMRSYSSLLAHVLGSSPEIDGYGEMHVRYRDAAAFGSLRRRIERSTGHKAQGRWLLDKILHNHIQPPDLLLNAEELRTIIFVRRPEATLRSILTVGINETPNAISHHPQLVCDYYVSRLHRLRVDGERLGKNAWYFDAEAFINTPQQFLATLGGCLELHAPLTTDYTVQIRSGEYGFGDPSPNIRTGRILGAEASTILPEITILPSILKEAEAAYQRCCSSLRRNCRVIGNSAFQ